MVVQALIIALFVYLCGMADVWLGQPMLDRPLIISTLVGVVLGDVKTGVICGAALEMAFIGVSTIGGTNPPDALSGSAIGTAFVILNHQDIATATALAVPVASLVVMLKNLLNPVRVLINPIGMRMIENDDDKKFYCFLQIPHQLSRLFSVKKQKYLVEDIVEMQLRLAIEQIKGNKKIDIDNLDDEQKNIYTKLMNLNEEIDIEKGLKK